MFFVASIILLFSLLFLFFRNRNHYWKTKGVRGPQPLPIFGNINRLIQRPVFQTDVNYGKQYGAVYGYYDGSKAILNVADPELIKQILVKDFHLFPNRSHIEIADPILKQMLALLRNEEWKRMRNIITPTFTTGKIKRMKPLMYEGVKSAISFLRKLKANEEIKLKPFWGRLTLEVITRCCFGMNTNFQEFPDETLVQVVKSFDLPWWFFVLNVVCPSVLPILANVFNPRNQPIEYLKQLVQHLLEERKKSENRNQNFNDFLTILREAQESDSEKHNLTDVDMIAQCILFFSAGYESTAATLQYCVYSLAVNPDVQEKLYEECKLRCPNGEEIEYETLNNLPYLEAVIKETLRMFPPGFRLERESSAEVTLGDITLPPKSLITIPLYVLYHNPDHFPEPELFKPERFLPENRDQIKPYTYLPFGEGLRSCVAMRFALIELKLAVFYTILNFRFVRTQNTAVPLKLWGELFVKCKDIVVGVEKR